jgi:membrane-bound serine protease (ClpP class)
MRDLLSAARHWLYAKPPVIALWFVRLRRNWIKAMTLGELAIILAAIGLVLVVSELLLPTHGILAIAGIASLFGAVITCFLVNLWLGIGSLTFGSALTPLFGAWLVHVWPKTRFGRTFVLPSADHIPRPLEPLPVQIGQTGIAVSELRPMGTCEFAGQRVEAVSELGIISRGQQIRVINITNRRPTVRAIG